MSSTKPAKPSKSGRYHDEIKEILVVDHLDEQNSALITLDESVCSLSAALELCSAALGKNVATLWDPLARAKLTDLRQVWRRERCVALPAGVRPPYPPPKPPSFNSSSITPYFLVALLAFASGFLTSALISSFLSRRHNHDHNHHHHHHQQQQQQHNHHHQQQQSHHQRNELSHHTTATSASSSGSLISIPSAADHIHPGHETQPTGSPPHHHRHPLASCQPGVSEDLSSADLSSAAFPVAGCSTSEGLIERRKLPESPVLSCSSSDREGIGCGGSGSGSVSSNSDSGGSLSSCATGGSGSHSGTGSIISSTSSSGSGIGCGSGDQHAGTQPTDTSVTYPLAESQPPIKASGESTAQTPSRETSLHLTAQGEGTEAKVYGIDDAGAAAPEAGEEVVGGESGGTVEETENSSGVGVVGGEGGEGGGGGGKVRGLGSLRVMVEGRRHTWANDNLFSWAVLGTAMRKLGLQEAKQGRGKATQHESSGEWNLLLCFTEECSGVKDWKWPDSFLTLNGSKAFNHFPGITELSGRDRLFQNLMSMEERFGGGFAGVMPETYLLPQHAAAFHAALYPPPEREGALPQQSNTHTDLWILKNLTTSGGTQVVFGEGKFLVSAETARADSNLPTTGQFLAQRYVSAPRLLHGRKFTLRLYLLVCSVDPLRVYLYSEGLAHLAVHRYSTLPQHPIHPQDGSEESSYDMFSHLTNEALAARHDEVLPLSSASAEEGEEGGGGAGGGGAGGKKKKKSSRGVGGARRAAADESRQKRCVLSLTEVRTALQRAEGGSGGGGEEVWRRIEELAVKAVLSAEDRLVLYRERLLQQEGQVFELLGMDVIIDKQLRPWLLKITDTVPNLQAETNLKYAMKERLVMDMLRMVSGRMSPPGGEQTPEDASGVKKEEEQRQQQQQKEASWSSEFLQKVERMERRWGVVPPHTKQMLYEFETEQQNRGGFKRLLPDVEDGSVGFAMEKYMMRHSDVTLRRWLTLDRQ